MEFKENAQKVFTDDFWYDITDGGYITPNDMLSPADAERVNEAIDLLCEFQNEATELNLLEEK